MLDHAERGDISDCSSEHSTARPNDWAFAFAAAAHNLVRLPKQMAAPT